MRKPTLLEIVQDILSSTSGEEVNSIFDTVESEQTARIVKDCYEVLSSNTDFPEKYGLFELEATSVSTPLLMTLPDTSDSLEWVKYDCRTIDDTESNLTDMKMIDLEDFLHRMYSISLSDSNTSSFTTTINNASVEVKYRTDRSPSYFTTYDDNTLLFDSIDIAVDANLQKNKTLCYGKLAGVFQLADTYKIDLDPNVLVLLKQEAKAQAWSELKLTENARAERSSKRLMVKLSQAKSNISPKPKYTGFGRKGQKYGK